MLSNLSRVAVLALIGSALSAQINVLTGNYGNERTNSTLDERILTTSNVNPASFGKLGAFPVDGQIYAQPLYVQGLWVRGRPFNVVFVATMHNTVYAFNADTPTFTNPLWSVNLGASVPSTFLNFNDIRPEVGILSTPVIDLSRSVIYVVAHTFVQGKAVFRLHALGLSDGKEKLDGPVDVSATVFGSGDASEAGAIKFDANQHLQRPGLLLANDMLYLAFGSHADRYPYHGWIVAYDASSLTVPRAVFNTTPEGGAGAIWQSGRGLAADTEGNIYAATGNGDYDGAANFGESFLKLSPDLKLLDWFTPKDWSFLSDGDWDLGALGPMLTPGTQQLIGGDKAGNMYLVDRNNLGHLGTDEMTYPQIVQPVEYGGIYSSALWESAMGLVVYVVEAGDFTRSFRSIAGWIDTTPFSETAVNEEYAFQGMTVSANGAFAKTGILWMTTGDHSIRGSTPGTLHAIDALDLSKELWNSEMNSDRDRLGQFTKFTPPTVANGRVYVPTQSNQLVIYGLLNPSPPNIPQLGVSRPSGN